MLTRDNVADITNHEADPRRTALDGHFVNKRHAIGRRLLCSFTMIFVLPLSYLVPAPVSQEAQQTSLSAHRSPSAALASPLAAHTLPSRTC